MKLYLNIKAFEELQGNLNNTKMAKKINVSRSQLWRVKSGEPVGEKFIAGVKAAYPTLLLDNFFYTKVFKQNDTKKLNKSA